MRAVACCMVLWFVLVNAVALPGCSGEDPARVQRRSDFYFEVRVSDPSGVPLEGLRVAAGSLLPCEFTTDCFETGALSPSPSEAGPQAAATLQFIVEVDSRVAVNITDRDGAHVRLLLDDALQRGSVYAVTWDGRDDAGKPMPGGVYEICMVATDLDSGSVLYQPDCILASLYTIPNMEVTADAIGHSGADGRLRITGTLPFPYLYGDELNAYNSEGTPVGSYSYTDKVSINVVDEDSGGAQRYIRTISDGANHFDLVFDPPVESPAAPPTRGSMFVRGKMPPDPEQVTWSFGPLYPNPFN